jgi:hypothetical protein
LPACIRNHAVIAIDSAPGSSFARKVHELHDRHMARVRDMLLAMPQPIVAGGFADATP